MTFNSNLGDPSGRASSGGSGSGGPQFGGFGGGRGGGSLLGMLIGSVGARFGLPGIIIAALVIFFLNGGGGIFGGDDSGQAPQQGAHSRQGLEHCRTWEDANKYDDCRVQATAVALDKFWSKTLPQEAGIRYQQPKVVIGSGQLQTGCGRANAAQSGPFYCPADTTAYFATPFFTELKRMGGSNGSFAQMYVVAHEFGHHIQKQQGTLGLSDYDHPGADSDAVRIELQADCYAGVWASQADKGSDAVLDPVTQQQVDQAVRSARAIGDDKIQQSAGQSVDPDKWTHGSAEQRVDAFLRGYQGGTMASCKERFNK